MDTDKITLRLIDQTECLKMYNAFNKTVDFYGKNNTGGKPIIFCTDGGCKFINIF